MPYCSREILVCAVAHRLKMLSSTWGSSTLKCWQSSLCWMTYGTGRSRLTPCMMTWCGSQMQQMVWDGCSKQRLRVFQGVLGGQVGGGTRGRKAGRQCKPHKVALTIKVLALLPIRERWCSTTSSTGALRRSVRLQIACCAHLVCLVPCIGLCRECWPLPCWCSAVVASVRPRNYVCLHYIMCVCITAAARAPVCTSWTYTDDVKLFWAVDASLTVCHGHLQDSFNMTFMPPCFIASVESSEFCIKLTLWSYHPQVWRSDDAE